MIRRNSIKINDLKQELLDLYNYSCSVCAQQFPQHQLIYDHITPVALGGSLYDRPNGQLLCYSCNKIKTKKDKSRIRSFKYANQF